jgi:gluconate kinase
VHCVPGVGDSTQSTSTTAIPQKLNQQNDHGGTTHQPNDKNSNKEHWQLTNNDSKMWLVKKNQNERGGDTENTTTKWISCNKQAMRFET